MSLRRSSRQHFNKGITIQKDTGGSSVFPRAMSNQKGRRSAHGSISRRVEDYMHAEQGDQRGQQQPGDVGRGNNSRGHCERCREEQMLTGDEIRRFDCMDEIVEQRSDLSSQEKPKNVEASSLDEGIQGASPDGRRSSTGLAPG